MTAMDKELASWLFRKVQKLLASLKSRNLKKPRILEVVNFLTDNFLLDTDQNGLQWNETGLEIKTFLLGILSSAESVFANDYFRDLLFPLQLLYELLKVYGFKMVHQAILNYPQVFEKTYRFCHAVSFVNEAYPEHRLHVYNFSDVSLMWKRFVNNAPQIRA